MSRVDEIPTEVLDCRTFIGHSWRHHDVRVEGTKRNPVYQEVMRCGTCGTERTTTINKNGDYVSGNRYHYDPEKSYLLKGGGRITPEERSQMRLRSVVSRLPKDKQPKRRTTARKAAARKAKAKTAARQAAKTPKVVPLHAVASAG